MAEETLSKKPGWLSTRVYSGVCDFCGEQAAWKVERLAECHFFSERIGDPVFVCESHYRP